MRTILTCAALLACAACQQPATETTEPVDTAADEAAIRQVEQAQIRAIQSKDAAGSVANYAKDAVFVGEEGQAIEGTAAIGEAFRQMTSDPALKFDYQQGKMVVSEGGDMAYSTASYTYTATSPRTGEPVTMKGSNLSVWRKQADGSWKLVADNNAGAPVEVASQ